MATPLGGVPSVALRRVASVSPRAKSGPNLIGTSLPGLSAMDECSDFASLERPTCPRFYLQAIAICVSPLSYARSLTQRPTRPSAYTVPGRAQDFHPHSLKRARSSPTPASCPTQPSLPITPGFYHDSYMHAQKHPRMWHSSAASNHTYAHAFCFPRSKSR